MWSLYKIKKIQQREPLSCLPYICTLIKTCHSVFHKVYIISDSTTFTLNPDKSYPDFKNGIKDLPPQNEKTLTLTPSLPHRAPKSPDDMTGVTILY